MALIICIDCNGKVSTRADSCPHCGAPVNLSDKENKISNEVSSKPDSAGNSANSSKDFIIIGIRISSLLITFFVFVWPSFRETSQQLRTDEKNLDNINYEIKLNPPKDFSEHLKIGEMYSSAILNSDVYPGSLHEVAERLMVASEKLKQEKTRYDAVGTPFNQSIQFITPLSQISGGIFDMVKGTGNSKDMQAGFAKLEVLLENNFGDRSNGIMRPYLDAIKVYIGELKNLSTELNSYAEHAWIYILWFQTKGFIFPLLVLFLILIFTNQKKESFKAKKSDSA